MLEWFVGLGPEYQATVLLGISGGGFGLWKALVASTDSRIGKFTDQILNRIESLESDKDDCMKALADALGRIAELERSELVYTRKIKVLEEQLATAGEG